MSDDEFNAALANALAQEADRLKARPKIDHQILREAGAPVVTLAWGPPPTTDAPAGITTNLAEAMERSAGTGFSVSIRWRVPIILSSLVLSLMEHTGGAGDAKHPWMTVKGIKREYARVRTAVAKRDARAVRWQLHELHPPASELLAAAAEDETLNERALSDLEQRLSDNVADDGALEALTRWLERSERGLVGARRRRPSLYRHCIRQLAEAFEEATDIDLLEPEDMPNKRLQFTEFCSLLINTAFDMARAPRPKDIPQVVKKELASLTNK